MGKVLHVELPSEHHLYWPELDIDLEVQSVFHPELYPLASRVHEARERYAAAEREGDVDPDRIDDCVLALLRLTLHDGDRAWKGFDYEVPLRSVSVNLPTTSFSSSANLASPLAA